MATILVVEDDATQQKILRAALERLNHKVLTASRVEEGFAHLADGAKIELIILDRQLPDGEGLKVCRRLKKDPRTRQVPVIVLTTLSQFDDELQTYKSGADLFLSKPVDLAKLRRYVATLLDRIPYRGEDTEILACGPLSLERKERRARVDGTVIEDIPEKLFSILYFLATHQGRLVSRKVIVQKLWGSTVRDKEVDVSISRLRRCLGPGLAGIIRSVRGDGYAVNLDFKPAAPPR